jgi:N-acetylneuraminate synthase
MQGNCIRIGNRRIGFGEPVYVIAELSANHNHDLEQAVNLIRAAKDAGADAIKLQTYTAETMTIRSDKQYFRISGGTLWDGRTLYDLYGEAFTPWDWHPKLQAAARELRLDFFSTAFDSTAVDFLESLHVPVHKIASFENGDIPLIEYASRTGKPLIISTGMAALSTIEEAVSAARSSGAAGVALFKCTSAYPAAPESMNLRTIPHLAAAFQTPVGLSDHTMDVAIPVAAVTLGACLIEKHLTLSRSVPGPDRAFSLEPDEFKAMVQAVRTAEKALGSVSYGPTSSEEKCTAFRRSLFVVSDLKKGERFTAANVRSIRPGHGLAPKFLKDVLGHSASADIERGTPLSWDLVAQ